MKRHAIVVVGGGCVLAVYTNDHHLTVTLVDRDNIEAGDPMPALPDGISDDPDTGLSVPFGWRNALGDDE